jgi:hypothetical protein
MKSTLMAGLIRIFVTSLSYGYFCFGKFESLTWTGIIWCGLGKLGLGSHICLPCILQFSLKGSKHFHAEEDLINW